MKSTNLITLLGIGMVAKKVLEKTTSASYLSDKVVLITGGSKGLGLTLAEQLIKENCKIAICARDEYELSQAKMQLLERGAEVFTFKCDISDKEQVDFLIEAVIDHFGKLDILINNAGIIQVGPMEAFRYEDYQKAVEIMYWGIANTTLSVLPHMKERQEGHIVNITSIGGKVSVPHLLPYNSAKFAATGFSEGSAAELKKDNITVTTIIPGLMRTGSYVNAFFQKGNKEEFKLFSFMSSAPLITLSADKAARRIIKAIKEKRSFKVIGIQARALMELNHFFPNFTTNLFSLVSNFIPAVPEDRGLEKGKKITEEYEDAEVAGFRAIGKKAQEDHQTFRDEA